MPARFSASCAASAAAAATTARRSAERADAATPIGTRADAAKKSPSITPARVVLVPPSIARIRISMPLNPNAAEKWANADLFYNRLCTNCNSQASKTPHSLPQRSSLGEFSERHASCIYLQTPAKLTRQPANLIQED
jgi:hypothetical protein